VDDIDPSDLPKEMLQQPRGSSPSDKAELKVRQVDEEVSSKKQKTNGCEYLGRKKSPITVALFMCWLSNSSFV
jgi:hypothetical protein